MNLSREKLHDLIDKLPDDRLSYLDDVFNQILSSELQGFHNKKINGDRNLPEKETAPSLEDIYRDQDV